VKKYQQSKRKRAQTKKSQAKPKETVDEEEEEGAVEVEQPAQKREKVMAKSPSPVGTQLPASAPQSGTQVSVMSQPISFLPSSWSVGNPFVVSDGRIQQVPVPAPEGGRLCVFQQAAPVGGKENVPVTMCQSFEYVLMGNEHPPPASVQYAPNNVLFRPPTPGVRTLCVSNPRYARPQSVIFLSPSSMYHSETPYSSFYPVQGSQYENFTLF